METRTISVILLVLCCRFKVQCSVISRSAATHTPGPRTFPKLFYFGVATAAYQIEGGWNASDKGESIWDRFTHQRKEFIFDRSNGDVAADSYHLFKDDVALLRVLGVDFYRFSVSWARVLPDGFSNRVSVDGVRYYNALIDELIRYNITPVVTMYHWDLPQSLEDLGGWMNPNLVDYFEDYARVLFEKFGDRVKTWITFNEPKNVCVGGYDTAEYAPAYTMHGVGSYLCAHTVLKAHAMVYRMYRSDFERSQKGSIGISLDADWTEPATDSEEDKNAAERNMQFYLGWFAHPLFSTTGDYPPVMRQIIDQKSTEQGFSHSRLPVFHRSEIDLIRGSADFLGLNHYTTIMVSAKDVPKYQKPSFQDDMGVRAYQKSSWPASNSTWLKVVPWGFRKTLNWIKNAYRNPVVIVTENGISSERGLADPQRTRYLHDYLRSLLDAILEDRCNVLAYAYWSLIDNFEWTRGYSERFGLFEVDYSSANKTRTPRNSAAYFRYVVRNRRLPAVQADAGTRALYGEASNPTMYDPTEVSVNSAGIQRLSPTYRTDEKIVMGKCGQVHRYFHRIVEHIQNVNKQFST